MNEYITHGEVVSLFLWFMVGSIVGQVLGSILTAFLDRRKGT